ncbi:MAG: nucleotidyltransferase [Candidatus Hydrogenedentes bacterium]|nr:nucleotidyltransferase [Candidatus Hydrogenedentota bacterium]
MAFRDYEEFIASLNANGVRYLIVGAHALAKHVRPRATEDLDIWIDRTEPNARKVLAALRQFYKGVDVSYPVEKFMDPENILRLGFRPRCIEVFTDLVSQLTFRQAWRNRVVGKLDSVNANFVGLEDLIQLKTDSGRPQDLVDVEKLNRALREVKKSEKRK